MRLTQIKLAGFKSFVDPTVIPTPSQLVGVVGPNGCGKSNIIDAVRWVLGETRASELRGESMQDVIFNGSGNRRPSARASVELVFDNSEGRVGGQWSTYSEISVGRVLTRDGNSSYYINNQQVRRRDIHDIFLGTGLGAKGYAIIGQGMINRLIEAKPEELRVYLEEAAGVSRYKERRKETESRLSDTRENLTRLDDIMSELEGQLERLHKQAEVAMHYKSLQEEGELKQHLLWLQRESSAKEDQQKKSVAIEQAQTEVEAAIGGLRSVEATLETLRQSHFDEGDGVHKAQAAVYEAGSRVSSLEAEIRHVQDTRNRMQSRRSQLDAQQQEWKEQQEYCAVELEELAAQQEEAAIRVAEAEAATEHAQELLPEQETQLQDLSAQRDGLRQQLARIEQSQAVRAQAVQDMQRQRQQLQLRKERLEKERADHQGPDDHAVQRLEGEKQLQSQQLASAQQALQEQESVLPRHEAARTQAQQTLQQHQSEHAKLEARLSALVQLQEDVQRQDKLEPWLEKHGLASGSRLWQQLGIEPGWETAVEAVLRDRVAAVSVADLKALQSLVAMVPPARVAFYSLPALMPATAVDEGSLLAKLRLSNPALQQLLQAWLGHVRVCASLDAAWEQVAQLASGQVIVCPEGHLLDQYSVRFYAPDDAQAGILARQQEITNLQKQLRASQLDLEQYKESEQKANLGWQQVSQQLPALRLRVGELTERLHTVQLEHARLRQEAEQSSDRLQRLSHELSELAQAEEELLASMEDSEQQAEELQAQQEILQEQLHEQEDLLERVSAELQEIRQQWRDKEHQCQEIRHQERLLQARYEELSRTQRVAREQLERAASELSGLQGELTVMDVEAAQESLQEALVQRAEKEELLTVARTRLEHVATSLKEAETERARLEQVVDPLRQKVTELQLQEQAARLSVEQFTEMLDDRKVDRHALRTLLQEKPEQWQRLGWLQSEVQRISRQIDALGAVNLAALEELATAKERKTYLDGQHEDLTQAIETLENAIRKIDREIRELLVGTFNVVNGHFGELFPRLFGGGEAKLIMTGDEVLDAGVMVMAQPPGKRNSTIHLLSGGEKALTATALVFALFKLNPAPFCLLDEVDAPLDDANTERYARLVSSMSDQTQFLFISHNKIAMHMAKQLVGVTMQEQGVSRIVAVDVESAIQMAEA